MTCPHYVEQYTRCILTQFFTEHTEQGIDYPGLPTILSYLRVIDLSQHCGVANQHNLCAGSTFDVSTLEVSDKSKEQYQEYQKKMSKKWANPVPPSDT